MDPDLVAAYLNTRFVADGPAGAICIRVGGRDAVLERVLVEAKVEEWAFVTAANPGSRRLTDEENELRTHSLREELSTRGLLFFAGEGVPEGDDWQPEPSFLVLGLGREAAVEMGRRFGQLAVVVGRTGASAELVWCQPTDAMSAR